MGDKKPPREQMSMADFHDLLLLLALTGGEEEYPRMTLAERIAKVILLTNIEPKRRTKEGLKQQPLAVQTRELLPSETVGKLAALKTTLETVRKFTPPRKGHTEPNNLPRG